MIGLQRLVRGLIDGGYGERLFRNEALSRHTSFAIGGPADLLFIADRIEDLRGCLRAAWAADVPALVIGGGSNILVSDAGIRGLVVVNACRGFVQDESGLLVAQSGTQLRELSQWTLARGWQGLEWAVGIPGTVGGAVVGNAGAYGGFMADVVRWVTLLRADGSEERVGADSLAYAYRTSVLKREPRNGHRSVVLEAAMQLDPGEAGALALEAARISGQRKARTPEGHCAGSVFKRTLQYPAGFLIEQVGLKGYRIGGAQISPKHANFVMNVGGATAADVMALVDKAREEVWAAFGQRLELEIELVGDWP